MSPITARATEIRVLQHHAQQLTIVLSRLDQGLLLSGQNPETHIVRMHLVETIRMSHGRISELLADKVVVQDYAFDEVDMYLDNRGLTP